MTEKVFLIFNTAAIGDILLNNALVQNIKISYPESKIVFVVQPQFRDVAKYQLYVDDVITFDKKKQGGVLGYYKFVKNFPYKKIFASFVIYKNERGLILSKLLGAKHIISKQTNIFRFLHTRGAGNVKDYKSAKDESAAMIQALTGNPCEILPIKYEPPVVYTNIVKQMQEFAKTRELVALCTNSNWYKKDMPIEVTKELIEKLNNDGKTVLFTGAGEVANAHLNELRKMGCDHFINLVDKTDFAELANILKMCEAIISVDTGTMHFATAVGTPVVAVFYEDVVESWGPPKELYKSLIVSKNQTADNIYRAFKRLLYY